MRQFRFVPVDGGVLEYGLPSTVSLESNLLEATLKLRVDTSGAGYSLYWEEVNGQFVMAGYHLPAARELALIKRGRAGQSYAQASENVTIDASSEMPVARCYKTQEPIFIGDAASETSFSAERAALIREFGITSIVLTPTAGGVIECGTSAGRETVDWHSIDDANVDAIPYSSLRTALADGVNEVIFWRLVGGTYMLRGEYMIPERRRALRQTRGDDESYMSRSDELFSSLLDATGQGPIATASRSGVEVVIQDVDASTSFQRKDLARELGVSDVHFVPLRGGAVLEFWPGGVLARTGASAFDSAGAQAKAPKAGGSAGSASSTYTFEADLPYGRVRQLNKFAEVQLGLLRAKDDIGTLRESVQVSRRATLIAPLATVSAIALAQYVTRPDFDFPGLDAFKEAWRLRGVDRGAEESQDKYFPGHRGSGPMDHLVDRALKRRGFTAENTLFATSVCPDEVNSKTRELVDLLKTRYGENFALVGLGGIPFAGTAGFTAYSHHVPDGLKSGGKMFVLFAPHVGIEYNGAVGELIRPNMKEVSRRVEQPSERTRRCSGSGGKS